MNLRILSLVSVVTLSYGESEEGGIQRIPIGSVDLPQAMAFDGDGSLYLTRSARAGTSDLDIREFPEWIPWSLGLTAVQGRQTLYRKELMAGRVPAKTSLKDFNQDGVVDHRDLTVLSEEVLKFEKPGAKPQTFATDFREEITGVASSVLTRNGDVHALISPDLWRFRDLDGDGKADRREKLLSGFGVHVGMPGHDPRGLIKGPDGKLYFVTGDKGMSVFNRKGAPVVNTDEGCVVRCEPDGTQFEVYARGLRDVRQIAFDDFGNLFGIDNHDDGGHLLFLAEGSDAGWRCYYDHRGTNYNPWLEEANARPAFILPPIRIIKGGASAFVKNPGTALDIVHRDSFFAVASTSGELASFDLKPRGASFRIEGIKFESGGHSLAGFAPDGALYLTDQTADGKSTLRRMDDASFRGTAKRQEVERLLSEGASKATISELVTRLKYPDQRVRFDAQWELAARPDTTATLIAAAGQYRETPLPLAHVLWALAQRRAFDSDTFRTLLDAKAEESRAQACRWAGACPAPYSAAKIIAMLTDPSLRVRYEAAMALGKLRSGEALEPALKMVANNTTDDHLLFHAGVCALRGIWLEDVVQAGLKHPSPEARLAVVVSLRTRDPLKAGQWLNDPDTRVAGEAVRTLFDGRSDQPADTMSKLADQSYGMRTFADAAARRLIAAKRISAEGKDALSLAFIASDKTRAMPIRLASLEALNSWPTELDADLLDGRPCDIKAGRLPSAPGLQVLATTIVLLFDSSNPQISILAGKIMTSLNLPLELSTQALLEEITSSHRTAERRMGALVALAKKSPETFYGSRGKWLTDPSPEFRYRASRLLAPHYPFLIQDRACETLENSEDSDELSRACELLGLVETPDAPQRIALFMDRTSKSAWDRKVMESLLETARSSAKLHPELMPKVTELEKRLASEGR